MSSGSRNPSRALRHGARSLAASTSSFAPWQPVVDDLLETNPAAFGRKDLALLNLLCAPNLPGSDDLDIARCLTRIDRLTEFVKDTTEKNLYCFVTP